MPCVECQLSPCCHKVCVMFLLLHSAISFRILSECLRVDDSQHPQTHCNLLITEAIGSGMTRTTFWTEEAPGIWSVQTAKSCFSKVSLRLIVHTR